MSAGPLEAGSLGFDAVLAAAARIGGHVHRTPVLTCSTFDRELGARVWWKCESFQRVGAFKARGAVNAILALPERAAARGVLTHSSGNHAAALAFAAGVRGISCTVVMPERALPVKIAAVRSYGAEIVRCPEGMREATCAALQAERGAIVIPPFDCDDVIAGQGTCALELLEEVPDLDLLIAPVGGGGLLAGTALAAAGRGRPGVRVLGAEPQAADDAARSLASGKLQPAPERPQTCADALLTGLGVRNFAILQRSGAEIVTVSEAAVEQALRDVLERMKIVIEPSSATVLAALRARREQLAGLRIGAIASGGNVDLSHFCAR